MKNADIRGIMKGFSEQLYVIKKALDIENVDILVIKGLIDSVANNIDLVCYAIELDELNEEHVNQKEQENE